MPDDPLEEVQRALRHTAAGFTAMTEAVRQMQAESAVFSMILAQLVVDAAMTKRHPRREAETILAAAAGYADGLRADLRSDPAAIEAAEASSSGCGF